MDITWKRVEVVVDDDGENTGWTFLDEPDDTVYDFDFMAFDGPWTQPGPYTDKCRALGAVGHMPRGAGNADTYVYLIRPDEYDSGEYEVALVDSETL